MGRLLTAVLGFLPEPIRTYAASGCAVVILGIMTVAFIAVANRAAPLPQTAVKVAVLCVAGMVVILVAIVIVLIALRLLQMAYRFWRNGA